MSCFAVWTVRGSSILIGQGHSRYAKVTQSMTDLKMDFYSLLFFVLIIWQCIMRSIMSSTVTIKLLLWLCPSKLDRLLLKIGRLFLSWSCQNFLSWKTRLGQGRSSKVTIIMATKIFTQGRAKKMSWAKNNVNFSRFVAPYSWWRCCKDREKLHDIDYW